MSIKKHNGGTMDIKIYNLPAKRLTSLGLNSLETAWKGGLRITSGWVGSSKQII